ncbi:MAG: CBS domain-containing protein, partial [Thermofilum sp.]|nr:CBS domain-containing protein [Thermofilum sp.]
YGVVSEYDVVNALRNGKSLDSPAASIATTSVVTIPADAPLSTAAELMTENRIRHLVVLEGGKVVGVISLRDIISAIRE